METEIKVTLTRFTIPQTIETSIGHVPLSSVDASTLDRLCEEFRSNVFKHANIEQPPTCDERASSINKELALDILRWLDSNEVMPGQIIDKLKEIAKR